MVLCGLIGATMGVRVLKRAEHERKQKKQISQTLCYCAFLNQGLRVCTKSGIQDLWSPERPFWWLGVLCHLLVLVVIGQHFHLLTGFMEMPAGLAPAHGAKTHLASIPSKIYEVLWRGRWEAQMPKAVININNTPTVPQVLCHTAGINELCSDPWQFTFWRSMHV